jgi:hypothetical protein
VHVVCVVREIIPKYDTTVAETPFAKFFLIIESAKSVSVHFSGCVCYTCFVVYSRKDSFRLIGCGSIKNFIHKLIYTFLKVNNS